MAPKPGCSQSFWLGSLRFQHGAGWGAAREPLQSLGPGLSWPRPGRTAWPPRLQPGRWVRPRAPWPAPSSRLCTPPAGAAAAAHGVWGGAGGQRRSPPGGRTSGLPGYLVTPSLSAQVVHQYRIACRCRRCKRLGFDPWVGKIPWRRKWQPTLVFLPGKPHGQNPMGYNPRGCKESDMTEHYPPTHTPHLMGCPEPLTLLTRIQ